jgi:polysaccharide export outer membrane protein
MSFSKSNPNRMLVVGIFISSLMAFTNISWAAPNVSQAQIDTFLKLPESQQRSMVMQLPDSQKKSIFNSLNESQQKALLDKLSASEKAIFLSTSNKSQNASAAVNVTPTAKSVSAKPKPTPPSVIEKAAQEISKQADLKDSVEPRAPKQVLTQFGYSLFQGTPSTFAPAADIPIPNEYIIGPGDEVNVLLFGKENIELSLTVTREGEVNFPRIGPIPVSGLSFKELKELLNLRISQQIIGVTANISLGSLRSIRIFVLGDVNQPGSYTVSSLSTMTNALFASGGIKPIGSLRDIELKRKGKVVVNFDLYDLLLHGDTSNDIRLLPGDVIFVKPLGKTVGIGGEVRRPAIYELGPKENKVSDLLNYSGGMLPTAYPKVSQIERISENGQRTLVDLDLSNSSALSKSVLDGDTLRIFSVLDRMNDIIMISGHVRRPGGIEWQPGLRVQDVLESMDELQTGADTDYALIRREDAPNGHVSVISVDLQEAISYPFGPANILLSPRDQLTVFSNTKNRAPLIKGLINELQAQTRFGESPLVVEINGNVRFPGAYPFEENMKISDLLRASLDLLPETDMQYALIRRENQADNSIEVFSFALNEELELAKSKADLRLQAGDQVTIFKLTQDRASYIADIVNKLKERARYNQPEPLVSILGNVKFPGTYPLESTMRVSDLVEASLDVLPATDMEYALLRRESKNRDLITLIPISLSKAMSNESLKANPLLQPRDKLIVLSLQDNRNELISKYISELRMQSRHGQPESVVNIIGNVKHPGAYPLAENMRVSDLVNASLGILPTTDMRYALIRRESLDRDLITIKPVSLSKALNSDTGQDNPILQPRDTLVILSLTDDRNELMSKYISELRLQARHGLPAPIVEILGNVKHPGTYPLSENMSVSDLVGAALNLLPSTDMDYALIQRVSEDDITTIMPVVLNNALSGLTQKDDIQLQARDRLIIFNKKDERRDVIEGLVNDLNKQAKLGQPALVTNINGLVSYQGAYPLTNGMRVSDLVIAAGGLKEAAYSMMAEITRYSIGTNNQFNTKHLTINLGQAMAQDMSQNVLLEPHDIVTIKQIPDWSEENTITITGEVRFPGTYPITKGETLTQVLNRAGGVSELGDPEAAVFSRQSLRDRESENKKRLISEMEMDMALLQKDDASRLNSSDQSEKTMLALASMQQVIEQVKQSPSLGRLVIELPNIVSGVSKDILVKNGDTLYIPQEVQEVSIVGEVMNPSAMLHESSTTLKQYIDSSGGLTSQADKSRIYVVKSNGSIVTSKPNGMQIFNNNNKQLNIEPGDMIVVPLDMEHMSALTKWTNISQISYQFAVTAASITALGIF